MAALINILWPGRPGAELAGDLRVAESAILVGFINGLVSQPYLERCLCDGLCARDNVEQRYYQLANFVVAMLGVALVVVHMAYSATVFGSPVVRWTVWITKVLIYGTLQFGLHVLHFCLKLLCARFMLDFA